MLELYDIADGEAQPGRGDPGVVFCVDDYEAVVLWNASVSELWRRTTIYLRRALARSVGVPMRALAAVVCLSYTKVVEYQRRGVVHLHTVVRLDSPDGPDVPPASPFTTDALTAAVIAAVPAVSTLSVSEATG